LLITAFSSRNISQPKNENKNIIKFSHKFHSELAECESCHKAVVTSTSLKDRLMPNHDNCIECHDVEDTEQCSTCHFDETYEPLIQKKSELLFNHSSHITDQQLKCDNCHKGLNTVDYSSELALPNPIMEDCFSCHKDQTKASNACESCHLSTADLKPQSHRSVSFITAHKFAASELNANCAMCHSSNQNSCEDCHTATKEITEKNFPDDFYQPYSPGNFTDDSKKQKINRVHDLNYRFSHGIDSKGKTTECQTCHEVETFCASCHQSENRDFALGGIVPASHLKPNFFTIGVGSGGGEHAILAKRDVERCASCHDVQGADPTCITCHLDSDGIKGTNPKTHSPNFMRDIEGDWHDSQGSICFNCHTSSSPSSPSGIAFCGYCHGGN